MDRAHTGPESGPPHGEPRTSDLVDSAVDLGKPLPGEDVESREAEDAVHWVTVYSELVRFKQAMLDVAGRHRESMSGDAAAEVERVDEALMRREMARLQHRRELWRERARELGAT